MKKLLNTKEASEITGFSISTIRLFVRTGQLKVVRPSPLGQMRFREEWLLNLTNAPEEFKEHKTGR